MNKDSKPLVNKPTKHGFYWYKSLDTFNDKKFQWEPVEVYNFNDSVPWVRFLGSDEEMMLDWCDGEWSKEIKYTQIEDMTKLNENAAVKILVELVKSVFNSNGYLTTAGIDLLFDKLHSHLTAAQVPSIEEIDNQWDKLGLSAGTGNSLTMARKFREWLLSRMGQPACENVGHCGNTEGCGAEEQPAQPATAEKLASFLTHEWGFEDDATEAAVSILKAFPSLGQGNTEGRRKLDETI